MIQKGAFPVALFYGLPWTEHFIGGRVGRAETFVVRDRKMVGERAGGTGGLLFT